MKRFLLVTILLFIFDQRASGEVTCPQCDASKCGTDGFYSCENCICMQEVLTFNCDSIVCGNGQRCIMEAADGMPLLPQCNPIPVTDTPPINKDEPKKETPNYDLLDMLGITVTTTKTPTATKGFFDSIDFPFQFEPEGTEKQQDCPPCSDFLCQMADCVSYPDAACVIENCTCVVSFVDTSGFPVNCVKHVDSDIPVTTTTEITKPQSTTTTKVVVETTTATELETPASQNIITISISILCAVLLICLIGFLIWKLRNVRIRKSKKGESDEEKAEVMKPLSENNNKHDAVCSAGDSSKVQSAT